MLLCNAAFASRSSFCAAVAYLLLVDIFQLVPAQVGAHFVTTFLVGHGIASDILGTNLLPMCNGSSEDILTPSYCCCRSSSRLDSSSCQFCPHYPHDPDPRESFQKGAKEGRRQGREEERTDDACCQGKLPALARLLQLLLCMLLCF